MNEEGAVIDIRANLRDNTVRDYFFHFVVNLIRGRRDRRYDPLCIFIFNFSFAFVSISNSCGSGAAPGT